MQGLIQINNLCREVKDRLGDQIQTTMNIPMREISIKLSENSNYTTLFKMLEQSHHITAEFYNLLCKTQHDRITAAQSHSFVPPLRVNSAEKPVEFKVNPATTAPSFSLN